MFRNNISTYSYELSHNTKLNVLFNLRLEEAEETAIFTNLKFEGEDAREVILAKVVEMTKQIAKRDECDENCILGLIKRLDVLVYSNSNSEVCDKDAFLAKFSLAIFAFLNLHIGDVLTTIRECTPSSNEYSINTLEESSDKEKDDLKKLLAECKDYWGTKAKPYLDIMIDDFGDDIALDTFMLGGHARPFLNAYSNAKAYFDFPTSIDYLDQCMISDLNDTFACMQQLLGEDFGNHSKEYYKELCCEACLEARKEDEDFNEFLKENPLKEDDYRTKTPMSPELITLMEKVHFYFYSSLIFQLEMKWQFDAINE